MVNETGVSVREVPQQEVEIQQRGNGLLLAAQSMSVTTQAEYENAGRFLVDVKTQMKKVEDYWRPLKQSAHAVWKQLVGKEKEFLDVLGAVETHLKGKMGSYVREQERLRLEAERVERERMEAERKAEMERLMAQAQAAQDAGNTQRADELVDTAAAVETVAIPTYVGAAPAPVAAGIGTRKTYKVEVLDAALVPVEVGGVCIRPVDEKLLNRMANTAKGKLNIPGIRVVEDISVSARAATPMRAGGGTLGGNEGGGVF